MNNLRANYLKMTPSFYLCFLMCSFLQMYYQNKLQFDLVWDNQFAYQLANVSLVSKLPPLCHELFPRQRKRRVASVEY